MTHLELSQELLHRVGFKTPLVYSFTPDPNGAGKSESGRYFQDEHSIVRLENIRACQPDSSVDTDDDLFNIYLLDLKRQTSLKLVHDVFKQVNSINDDVLLKYPMAFDEAIALRMVVDLGEMIINSQRTSGLQRVTAEMKSNFYRELNGVKPKEYVTESMGILARYKAELKTLRKLFQQQTRLSSRTAGDLPLNHRNIRFDGFY